MNTEQHDAKSPNAKRHKRIDAQQLQLGLDESPPSSPVPWQSVELATYLPDAWLRQYLREHPMRLRKHLLESESRGTLLTQFNYLSIIDASKVSRRMCNSAIGPWIPSAGFQHWVHTGLSVGVAREASQLMPVLVELLKPRLTQFFPDLELQVVLGPDKQAVATLYGECFKRGCWKSLLGGEKPQHQYVYCTLQLLHKGQLQCATSVKFHGGVVTMRRYQPPQVLEVALLAVASSGRARGFGSALLWLLQLMCGKSGCGLMVTQSLPGAIGYYVHHKVGQGVVGWGLVE